MPSHTDHTDQGEFSQQIPIKNVVKEPGNTRKDLVNILMTFPHGQLETFIPLFVVIVKSFKPFPCTKHCLQKYHRCLINQSSNTSSL